MTADFDPVLWTNSASCMDCNRCVGVCPVKAVEKDGGQARIMPERCLLCGMCVRECPQQAKSYLHGIETVRKLINSSSKVSASVAPSYLSTFERTDCRVLPSLLRHLGFDMVTETAVGAEVVSRASRKLIANDPGGKYISSSCPSVVRYIQRYRPEACSYLMEVISPMIAHARFLKQRKDEEHAVVFIGPCLAKKEEARADPDGSVDAVLTFEELKTWITEAGLSPSTSEESGFDGFLPRQARSFPVDGGFANTMDLSTDQLDRRILSATNPAEVVEAVDYILETKEPTILEALMCPAGCLGGPGTGETPYSGPFETRKTFLDLLADWKERTDYRSHLSNYNVEIDLNTVYRSDPLETETPEEYRIRETLAETGKYNEEDELNCGACGYDTCRGKAIAVIRGMAESEMCLPYMRRREEQKTDTLIENSPNAIVILDRDLNIMHANPRFHELFMTSDYCKGKNIDYYMDPTPFRQVLNGELDFFDETVEHKAYSLTYQQVIYSIGTGDSLQLISVLVNLTQSKKQEEELDLLRTEALERAEEVIERQVEIAQEVTRLLGRSTSASQKTLRKLITLVRKKEVGE